MITSGPKTSFNLFPSYSFRESLSLFLKPQDLKGYRVALSSVCPIASLVWRLSLNASPTPRSVELRTQKLKSHLLRLQSLKVLPEAWSRSVYSHTYYAYCQGFLPRLFLPFGPFTCIFSKTSSNFFLCWL